jgi:hypothetical protein
VDNESGSLRKSALKFLIRCFESMILKKQTLFKAAASECEEAEDAPLSIACPRKYQYHANGVAGSALTSIGAQAREFIKCSLILSSEYSKSTILSLRDPPLQVLNTFRLCTESQFFNIIIKAFLYRKRRNFSLRNCALCLFYLQ